MESGSSDDAWETEESDIETGDDSDEWENILNNKGVKTKILDDLESPCSSISQSDSISNNEDSSVHSSDNESIYFDSDDSSKSGHIDKVPCGVVLASLKHLLEIGLHEATEEALTSLDCASHKDVVTEKEASDWLKELPDVDEGEYRDIVDQFLGDVSDDEWNYVKIDVFLDHIEHIDVTGLRRGSDRKIDLGRHHGRLNDAYLQVDDLVLWLHTNIREDGGISVPQCHQWVENKELEIITEFQRCCEIHDGQQRSNSELCKANNNIEFTLWLEAEDCYVSAWYEEYDIDECIKSPTETDMNNGYIRVSLLIDKLYAESEVKGTHFEMLEQQCYVEDKVQNVLNIIKRFDQWFEIEERIGTGSFYDGTKILEADEFDYLGILAKSSLFEVEDGCQPGTCHFKINDKAFLDHINTTVAERIFQHVEHPDGSHFPPDTESPDELDKLMKKIRGSDDESGDFDKTPPYPLPPDEKWSNVEDTCSDDDTDSWNLSKIGSLFISGYVSAEMMNKYFSSLVHRSFITHNRSYGGHYAILDPLEEAPGFDLDNQERTGPNVQSSISGPLCDADVDFTLAVRIDPNLVSEEKYGHLKHPSDPCIAVAKPRSSVYSGCSLVTSSPHEGDAETNNFCWLMSFSKAEARRVKGMKPHHKKIHKILKLFASKKMLGKANNSYVIKTIMCKHDERCVLPTNAECLFEVLGTIKHIINVKEVCENSTNVPIALMLGITKVWLMEGENMPGYDESSKELYEELAEGCKHFGLKDLSDFDAIKSETIEWSIASQLMGHVDLVLGIQSLIESCHVATIIAGMYHSWVLSKPFYANMHIPDINVINGLSLRDVYQGFPIEETEETFDDVSNVVLRCQWIIEECLSHHLKIQALIQYFDRIKCLGGKKLLSDLLSANLGITDDNPTPYLNYIEKKIERRTGHKQHFISESLDEYRAFLDNVIEDKNLDNNSDNTSEST